MEEQLIRLLAKSKYEYTPERFTAVKGLDDAEITALEAASASQRNHCSLMKEHGGTAAMISRELAFKIETRRREEAWEAQKDEPWKELGIDIETYSSNPIQDCGVYKYVEAADFEILLFAYSKNGGPAHVVDLAQGEKIPEDVMKALEDPAVLKTAFNAAFERTCIGKKIAVVPVEQWDCTMVACARMGFPLSLAEAGEALGLDKKKMGEGKSLIRKFSIPCKPTKVNGGRTRNLPEHDPEAWADFKRYCARDVDVEQAIRRKVARQVPAWEMELWFLDQRINDRGVGIDVELARAAMKLDGDIRAELREESIRITGLANPNSLPQLKAWIHSETGVWAESLTKDNVAELLQKIQSRKVRRALEIRQELGKTSTKKYETMLECVCRDGRARGLLQFYGAVRTGRWAGRLVQLQNLPQNHLPDIELARDVVKRGDLEELQCNYASPQGTLSELIRTALVAKPGHVFHVCDFSAIEARVIAWLAGEEWVLEVFRTTGKIYEAAAARMYGCDPGEITKTDPRRQKGKIATLALGYNGGVDAFKAMGGDRMGLSDADIQQIIKDWRRANPKICRLWKHVDAAAMCVAEHHQSAEIERGITFEYRWGGMLITLPSRRRLFYPRIRVQEYETRWGTDKRVCYDGKDQATNRWGRVETYGGKLTENIVQAIARDLLGVTMLRLDRAGFRIVFHVHDEAIVEAAPGQELGQIEEIFSQAIPWAPGLPLKGAGYTTPFYLKD